MILILFLECIPDENTQLKVHILHEDATYMCRTTICKCHMCYQFSSSILHDEIITIKKCYDSFFSLLV